MSLPLVLGIGSQFGYRYESYRIDFKEITLFLHVAVMCTAGGADFMILLLFFHYLSGFHELSMLGCVKFQCNVTVRCFC